MCASSWAIAVAGTVSDLQCEMYDKQIQLSPQPIISCVGGDDSSCEEVTYDKITASLE